MVVFVCFGECLILSPLSMLPARPVSPMGMFAANITVPCPWHRMEVLQSSDVKPTVRSANWKCIQYAFRPENATLGNSSWFDCTDPTPQRSICYQFGGKADFLLFPFTTQKSWHRQWILQPTQVWQACRASQITCEKCNYRYDRYTALLTFQLLSWICLTWRLCTLEGACKLLLGHIAF